jgi:hypothetical protein
MTLVSVEAFANISLGYFEGSSQGLIKLLKLCISNRRETDSELKRRNGERKKGGRREERKESDER